MLYYLAGQIKKAEQYYLNCQNIMENQQMKSDEMRNSKDLNNQLFSQIDPIYFDQNLKLEEISISTLKLEDEKYHLLRAQLIEPQQSQIKILLGQVYKRQQNIEKAEQYFKSAFKVNPYDYDSINNLILFYFEQKNYEKVKNYCLKLLQINPSEFKILFQLGIIFFEQKQFSEAQRYFQKCIEIYPQSFNSQFNLTFVYEKMSKVEHAQQQCLKALEINLDHFDLFWMLNVFLIDQGETEHAKKYFNQILKRKKINNTIKLVFCSCYSIKLKNLLNIS